MKSSKTAILSLSVFTIALCSQAAAALKSGDGNAIPYPKKEWKGVQGKTLADSKPYFVGQPKAPDGAPNVLVIMLDDAGYSNATSYGGVMRTSTFDRIANEGIRYTHMSVAAVCSPTRGSLLTGYNIHQIGTGIISEFATGYPGYNSQIDYTTPSIARILTDNGYATAAFGKWHNTPMEEASPAGPFESWPTGIWGFEYFWGFLGGETNQFHPLLYENTTAIDTPATNADGSEFHLSQGMADQAIQWLDNWKGLRDVPFFIYYTPGAVHAPIQVPKEWRDKYTGQFDDGWHAYRAQQLERQKKLGLVPKDARMVDWPEVLPTWDSFSKEGKAYLARQMEVNAAFLEHVDYHIGRLIEHLEEMGELDNTLIIYLTADNGATAEGTPTGTFSELLMQNGFPPLTMEQQLEKLEEFGGLDAWGGPHMANHFSVAWAYASSTPFQWTKQMASHFGGTMSATAIRYPKAIEARGEWRRQFQNITDLVPTILEVTGVPAPDYVNGQKRKPYPGKSLTYAWNNPDAKTNHPTQYFEMLGFVGLYHDGWTIAGKPYRIPWSMDPQAMAKFDPLNTEWELYNIEKDPIQQVNVADKYPKKVKELETLFWEEADKYDVYPIGGSMGRPLQPESNPQRAGKKHWELTPNVYRVPELAGPEIKSTNYEVNAYITADDTTEGVIYAVGEHIGGQALFIKDGKLRYSYSTLGLYWHDFDGDVKIPAGDLKITLKHTMKEPVLNGPSTVELFINDSKVGEMDITATVYGSYTAHETFDIGRDEGMPVNEEYADKGKFIFTPGQLHKVVFDIKNPEQVVEASAYSIIE
ncbi:MAG: arylsulfatase [Opitutaceae bacterium]